MGRNWKTRCFAWMLAGTMALTGLPSEPVPAEEAMPPKLADFDFNTGAADGVFTGGGAKADAIGGAQAAEKLREDKALYLSGTAYLNVTAADGSGLLAGKEEITISYDAKPESGSAGWPIFAAPNVNKQTYQSEHYLAILHSKSEITAQRYHNSGTRPGNDISKKNNPEGWIHVDLVVSEAKTKLYVNGTEAGEAASSYKLSDILGTSGGVVQIGRGNWNDGEFFKGWIDNYRIYDGALTEAAITAQYGEFQQFLKDLSDYENRTPLEKDQEALVIQNPDDVRGNLPLIRKGPNGSSISWESDKPEVVEVSPEEPASPAAPTSPHDASSGSAAAQAARSSLYAGGIVHRPEAGEDPEVVHLKATLTYDGKSKTKEFTVTVQPKPADLDTNYTAGYLWANFSTEDGYEKIFLGYSEDGLSWKKLNKLDGSAQSILENNAPGSDLGVRDPHLIRSAEGDRYWILGTDLHAEGGGAGGSGWNQLGASQNLVVWESDDLVHWSEPHLVYTGFQDAGCVWAPEAIYDEAAGDYVVYWSARDKSKADTQENALRVYVCRTRDFHTFSEPKVWLSEDQDSGNEVNIIDSTIVEGDDGKFYRFSTSDWNTVIDVSDTLDTEDVLDVRNGEQQSTPNGSWKRLVTRSGSSEAGFDGREGLTVYKLPDGKWCIMGDNQGYKAFVIDDLAKLGSKDNKVTGANASFDEKFRHGTVVRLSAAEQARVLEAYKDRETPGEDPIEEPVLKYDFESDLDQKTVTDSGAGDETAHNGTLFGSAKVVYDEELKSNVLKLDGSDGGYAEIPKGFFDNRDVMTISMDVKAEKNDKQIFTFTYGKSNKIYDFLRVDGTTVRNAITLNGWENNAEKEVKGTGAAAGNWQKVVIVIRQRTMKLYVDGTLISENRNTGIRTSDMGTELLSYLGKSFYSGDGYFKGCYDNFEVYNRELTRQEIIDNVIGRVPLLKSVTLGTVPADPSQTMGTDDHTAVTSHINYENHEITSYLRKGTDLSAVPLKLNLLTDEAEVKVNGTAFNGTVDLSSDAELTVAFGDETETYQVKVPKTALNPVLPGQYADPDIDYFDGKYWIYPTTDGYTGWSGTVFHAWSSENLEDWTDEGVILDLAADEGYKNEKNVDVAVVPWSTGNAWAPSIEKKGDKYYFYFCGHDTETNAKAIGVAWADHPAGPYTVKDKPLISISDCKDSEKISMGQAIDPSIFTDKTGTSYLYFGNGNPAVVELNADMISYKAGTMKNLSGLTDFRESVVVTERNGLYHFTWSCDDANSPNYHVNYGTADSLYGPVTYRYTLLQKDEDKDMLGTAHQSLYYDKETDKCYMAYHRFYTPLGIYTTGLGVHRTTCIDEVTFDEETGYMNPMKPTMEGVTLLNHSAELNDRIEGLDLSGVLPGKDSGIKIETAEKLQLPQEYNGVAIRWESGDTDVIANDGTVTLPEDEDAEVTMTAVFTYLGSTIRKTYTVVVAHKTDQQKLEEIVAEADFSAILNNGTITKEEALKLPKELKGAAITWSSDKKDIIADDGTVKLPKEDTTVTLTATFTYKDAEPVSKEYPVTVKGKSDAERVQEIAAEADFGDLFPKEPVTAEGKLNLPTELKGASIAWTSSRPEVIANDGTIKLPKEDTTVTLTAVFTYGEATSEPKTYSITVKGNGGQNPSAPETDQQKLAGIVAAADFGAVFGNKIIETEARLNLPSALNGASISWSSSNPGVIAADGTVKLPKEDTAVTLTATFTYGTAKASKSYLLTVKGIKIPVEKPEPIEESIVNSNPGIPSGRAEESKKSSYAALSAKVSSAKKNSLKLQWSKVSKADGYVVFGNRANVGSKKYKYQLLKVIEKNSVKTYTHSKLAKGTYYKYIVQAYKLKDGKPQIIATSKTLYASTAGGKNANVSSLKLNKTKVNLKAGKKFTLKATAKKSGQKLKTFRKVSFESSNTKIATVNAKGVIKAKKKGTCYIYVYAQNGVSKKVKVTVKKK